MTTTTGGQATLLCCCSSASYSSSPLRKFKIPAKSPVPTVQFSAKSARSLTTAFAFPPTSLDDNGDFTSYGRRGLLFLSATLPFLFPLQERAEDLAVEAEELGSPDYLLIKGEIRKVLSKGKAAGVLRLVFHDAGTFESSENSGGMNGSITYELDRPENTGLKKSLKILDKAKKVVEERQSVSWADMIAVAGAEAVSLCGGPEIPVQLGRLDSLTSDPEGKLPEETLDAPSLKQCFQRKGFSNSLHCLEPILLGAKVSEVLLYSTMHTTKYSLRNHGCRRLECRV